MWDLSNIHRQDTTLISSTKSSTSKENLLKIVSFLALHKTQMVVCQNNQRPLTIFLLLPPRLQHSQWTKRLGGIKNQKSNHNINFNHTKLATPQCKKRCKADSSTLSHKAHNKEESDGNTFLKARLPLVGIQLRKTLQANATTFNSAGLSHIFTNTLFSPSPHKFSSNPKHPTLNRPISPNRNLCLLASISTHPPQPSKSFQPSPPKGYLTTLPPTQRGVFSN